MELIIVFLLFCLSKNHLRGFTSYENPGWNQVFFINEDKKAQLFVDGYPVGIQQAGSLFFPPACRKIHVQYVNGEEIVFESDLYIQQPKTFFMVKWQQARLLRVK